MGTLVKQANFLLPEDLLDELRKSVPKRQQSRVVAESLRMELRRMKLERSLQSSFGAWKHEKHPELKKGSHTFIRALRKSTRLTRTQ